jgi:hypothetical protein
VSRAVSREAVDVNEKVEALFVKAFRGSSSSRV